MRKIIKICPKMRKIFKIDPKIRKIIIICPKIKNHHWTCAWAPKIKRSSKSMQKWEKSSKIVQKWKNHQNLPKNEKLSLNVTWDPMGTFWTQGNTGFLIFKKTSHEERKKKKEGFRVVSGDKLTETTKKECILFYVVFICDLMLFPPKISPKLIQYYPR